ncbi:flagellar protein FlaG [Lysinibacillus xylanilyticus]|uniref:flagellar protein FlaG n=1 Tax=Lysinibacillus xylanilyticus TaxID=582475 RepID=UPI0037FEAC81
MRITTNGTPQESVSTTNEKVIGNTSDSTSVPIEVKPISSDIDQEASKEKLQQVISMANRFLDINNSTSKFVYHEGLKNYYITIVNRETNEVVKEIPPKKLLDAFYEMQKMVGMIVDEKI